MKQAEIYSDGSWYKGKAGYGALILENGETVHTLSGAVNEASYLKHRQVAGELEAVRKSLMWCIEKGYQQVTVYYDYLGIQYWAEGNWQAKTAMTQDYRAWINSLSIDIVFQKVKAHSGNKYNDQADRLAKAGCGAETETRKTTESKPASASTLQEEAEKAATDIMTALIEDGILCNYGGFMNNMFARIELLDEGKRCGIIDLYNTKKKRLKPDPRGFKDIMLQKIAEEITQKVIEMY